MRLRLKPLDGRFFPLFSASATHIVDGVALLAQALPADADRAALAERLREVERQADETTHEIVRTLRSTFVTPFDREDVYRLASQLDDVLDHVEAALDFMVLYRVGAVPSGVTSLVNDLQRAAEVTARAMPRLRVPGDLRDYWVEVNRLENQAGQNYRRALAHLFSGEYDPLTVHKLKDVLDALEAAADGFEGVANTIEQIALKES